MKDIKDCIKSLKEKSDFYDGAQIGDSVSIVFAYISSPFIEQATKIASQRAAAAKALIAEQYTGYRVRGTYAPPSSGRRTGEYRYLVLIYVVKVFVNQEKLCPGKPPPGRWKW